MSVLGVPGRLSESQFLETVAGVFAERGFDGSSFAEISTALRVTRPTLYAYSRNKAGLLAVVLERLMTDYDELIAERFRDGDPPLARMQALVRVQLMMLRRRPECLRLALQSMRNCSLPLPEAFRVWVRVMDARTMGIIHDGQADGTLRADIPPRILRNLLRSVLNELPFWYRPDGPLDDAGIVATVVSVISGGAAAAGTRAMTEPIVALEEQTTDRVVARFCAIPVRVGDPGAMAVSGIRVLCARTGFEPAASPLTLYFPATLYASELLCVLARMTGDDGTWSVTVSDAQSGRMVCAGHVLPSDRAAASR